MLATLDMTGAECLALLDDIRQPIPPMPATHREAWDAFFKVTSRLEKRAAGWAIGRWAELAETPPTAAPMWSVVPARSAVPTQSAFWAYEAYKRTRSAAVQRVLPRRRMMAGVTG